MEEVGFISRRKAYLGEVLARCSLCGAVIASAGRNVYKLNLDRRRGIYIGTSLQDRLPASCGETIRRAGKGETVPCALFEIFSNAAYFDKVVKD